MYEIVIVLFLIVAIAMVALILIQQGKGAGMGASFGTGASNTVFGSAGSGGFLTRATWACVILFFGICLFIGWMQKNAHQTTDSFSNLETETTATQSAAPEAVTEDIPVVSETDAPTVDDTNDKK